MAAGPVTLVGACTDTAKAGSRAAFHCAKASAAERGTSCSAAGSAWIGALAAGVDAGIDGAVSFVTTTGGLTGGRCWNAHQPTPAPSSSATAPAPSPIATRRFGAGAAPGSASRPTGATVDGDGDGDGDGATVTGRAGGRVAGTVRAGAGSAVAAPAVGAPVVGGLLLVTGRAMPLWVRPPLRKVGVPLTPPEPDWVTPDAAAGTVAAASPSSARSAWMSGVRCP